MDQTGDVQWRSVSTTARYDERQQVLVRNRSYNGIPVPRADAAGVLPSGDAVIVDRGFVPLETSGDKPDVPAAPSGVVTVDGRVRGSQQRGRFGPRDPAEGTLTQVAHADLVRLQQQMPYRILPVYVELESSNPADSTALTPRPASRARRGATPQLRDPVVHLLGARRHRMGPGRAKDGERVSRDRRHRRDRPVGAPP